MSTKRGRGARTVGTMGAAVIICALVLPNVDASPAGATSQPSVTAVIANSGPLSGGQRVTILGSNLASPVSVVFGSHPATVRDSSSSTITVTSPAGSAGVFNVRVTTAGGLSPTNTSDLYTYVQNASVYVADSGSASEDVTPITLSDNNPHSPISVGSGPKWVAITPDGQTAYVADSGSDDVQPIALATGITRDADHRR